MNPEKLVIMALPRPDYKGGFIFWCPFCNCWHRHGVGKGHRVAHCTNPVSPFNETGYILKPIPKAIMKKLAKAMENDLNNLKKTSLPKKPIQTAN
jgi:hypothetical protein